VPAGGWVVEQFKACGMLAEAVASPSMEEEDDGIVVVAAILLG
jgi:hypothetical protein